MDRELIARRAYAIWQREGCPDGRAWQHWFRAEAELRAAAGGGVVPDPYTFQLPGEDDPGAAAERQQR